MKFFTMIALLMTTFFMTTRQRSLEYGCNGFTDSGDNVCTCRFISSNFVIDCSARDTLTTFPEHLTDAELDLASRLLMMDTPYCKDRPDKELVQGILVICSEDAHDNNQPLAPPENDTEHPSSSDSHQHPSGSDSRQQPTGSDSRKVTQGLLGFFILMIFVLCVGIIVCVVLVVKVSHIYWYNMLYYALRYVQNSI